MAKVYLCPKCGAGLAPGFAYCRLCGRKVDADVAAALAASVGSGAVASPGRPAAGPAVSGGADNPFLTIWLHPRDTIRAIVATDPKRFVQSIVMLGGIFEALDRMASRNAGDLLSFPVILLIALIVGPLSGVLGLYLSAALLRFSGRWIGGTATPEAIRAAAAWGSVPLLAGNLLWLPALAIGGHDIFTAEMANTSGVAALALLGIWLVQIVAAVWSIFTGLHCLGEVQGFSAWKALGNAVLAGLVILVPVLVLAAIVLIPVFLVS